MSSRRARSAVMSVALSVTDPPYAVARGGPSAVRPAVRVQEHRQLTGRAGRRALLEPALVVVGVRAGLGRRLGVLAVPELESHAEHLPGRAAHDGAGELVAQVAREP